MGWFGKRRQPDATEIIKNKRNILFMLNLMRWKRVPKDLSYLDAKPPGEGAFNCTATNARIGKKRTRKRAGKLREPEGQGPAGCGERVPSVCKNGTSAPDLRSEHERAFQAAQLRLEVRSGPSLVPEVADAGKDHGQAEPVGGVDDFLVALPSRRAE